MGGYVIIIINLDLKCQLRFRRRKKNGKPCSFNASFFSFLSRDKLSHSLAAYHLHRKTGIFGEKFKWYVPFHWKIFENFGKPQTYSFFPFQLK